MKDKKSIYVIIGILILILAYNLFISPKNLEAPQNIATADSIALSDQLASLGITKTEVVTGTLVEMNSNNLIIQTSNGISTLKKSDVTRYFVISDGISTPVDENKLQLNDMATIIVGVHDTTNEMTAIRLRVER